MMNLEKLLSLEAIRRLVMNRGRFKLDVLL
jgi:hypothetical protein